MNIEQIVEKALIDVVNFEISTLLPQAAKLVPGAGGVVVSDFLSQPAVQAKLKGYVDEGIVGLFKLFDKGILELVDLIKLHVHGKLGAAIASAADATKWSGHIKPEWIRAMEQKTEAELDTAFAGLLSK